MICIANKNTGYKYILAYPLGFTGIDSAYEPPSNPELVLKAGEWSVDQCVQKVVDMLMMKVSGRQGG